jgi:hypothetical protein
LGAVALTLNATDCALLFEIVMDRIIVWVRGPEYRKGWLLIVASTDGWGTYLESREYWKGEGRPT